MKYIMPILILTIVSVCLSACSDIPEQNKPDITAPPPLGGSSAAPLEKPPRENSSDSTAAPEQKNTPEIPQNNPLPDNTEAPPEATENITENNDNVPEILTEISTHIYDKTENRMVNLNLAAEAVSGTVLAPGESFSFNDIVGNRTADKGYKPAMIIAEGKHVDGIGGGVCQISTTIYLAVLDCGLEITERHRHEEEVAYAPGGTDCTVNYDNLDFKFKNNSDKTIQIDVSVGKEKVTAKILTNFST